MEGAESLQNYGYGRETQNNHTNDAMADATTPTHHHLCLIRCRQTTIIHVTQWKMQRQQHNTRHHQDLILTANSRPCHCQRQHKQQQARRPKYQENRLFALWRRHDQPWHEDSCSSINNNNIINGRRP